MAIEAGQELLHYRLIEKIGAGGMGVVWRALDTTLDREVALKVLPDDVAGDPGRLSRFEREAKALASLDHPNIVTIHSVERSGDVRFITMELVRGRPLARAIPEGGLSLQELLRISIALADALNAAHEKGVIHRDLKPANVMIGKDGRVRVLDFGLVKLNPSGPPAGSDEARTATATRLGQVIGTLPYMSPEQLKGEAVDHRTDIFSLGVTIHEMAVGSHPFRVGSQAELVAAILTATPPSLSEIRSTLPSPLGHIIRRCMEKDPARRYASALEVRNDLADLELSPTVATAADAVAGHEASPAAPKSSRKQKRREKREADDLGDTLRRAIERGGDSGKAALGILREQELHKARKEAGAYILGGAITAAVGIGLMPFLYLQVPDEPVWPIGGIPLIIGVVLILWGGIQIRKTSPEG